MGTYLPSELAWSIRLLFPSSVFTVVNELGVKALDLGVQGIERREEEGGVTTEKSPHLPFSGLFGTPLQHTRERVCVL